MKRFIIAAVAVCTITLVSSCSNNQDSKVCFTPQKETTLDSPQRVAIEQDIALVYCIKHVDDKIMTLDQKSINTLNIFKKDGEWLGSYAPKGRGNGRYEQPMKIDIFEKDGKKVIGMFDYPSGKYVVTDYENPSTFELEMGMRVTARPVIHLQSDKYLAAIETDSAMMALLDANGEILGAATALPKMPTTLPKKDYALILLNSNFATTKNHNYFARAMLYDGGIDCFEIVGNNILHKWRFAEGGVDIDYEPMSRSILLNDRTRTSYTAIDITDDKIYALYANWGLANMPMGHNEIHVFDLEGNHLERITLSEPINLFDVTDDNKSMVTYRDNYDSGNKKEFLIYSL